MGPIVLGECDAALVGQLHDLKEGDVITFYEDDGFTAERFLQIQAERMLGAGETECITLAEHCGGKICCDDGKGRRIGAEILGESQVTGSIGLLKHLVCSGVCSVEDAFGAYSRMVDCGGFLPELHPEFFETL